MNTSIAEGTLLAKQISFLTKELEANVEVIIAPPFTHLAGISSLLKQEASKVSLSAQNCADQLSGAYTGEVSVKMLEDIGCKYVIIGHSERREYYGETNAILLKKIELALSAGLSPIYCVGEKLNEREENRHFEVVAEQIKEVLYMLKGFDMNRVVVAYEPVWAIGTGETASPEQAQEMHAFIRKIVADKYGENVAADVSILYGGSVKPSNAQEIFSKPDVDGGLIGGAALNIDDFKAIIDAI